MTVVVRRRPNEVISKFERTETIIAAPPCISQSFLQQQEKKEFKMQMWKLKLEETKFHSQSRQESERERERAMTKWLNSKWKGR